MYIVPGEMDYYKEWFHIHTFMYNNDFFSSLCTYNKVWVNHTITFFISLIKFMFLFLFFPISFGLKIYTATHPYTLSIWLVLYLSVIYNSWDATQIPNAGFYAAEKSTKIDVFLLIV